MMHELCALHGTTYLHGLVPNQYVPDSKPISAEELENAWAPNSNFARWARIGYPLLQEAGAGLRAGGVRFHDLTGVYRGVEEPVYRDHCCHLNARGHELLGQAVAELILAAES